MARVLGLATILKYDSDDSGATFDTIALGVEATPPPRRRVRIPAVALSDTLAVDEFGIEDVSDYVFTTFREPNDTQSALFNSIFTAKTALLWQIVYASTDTEQFEGKIAAIEHGGITPDGLIRETITVHRTGASTWT